MFVATITADCGKLQRSGMNEGFGTPSTIVRPTTDDMIPSPSAQFIEPNRPNMPLLPELVLHLVSVAISMALLTELTRPIAGSLDVHCLITIANLAMS